MKLNTSIKVSDDATQFLKKCRINIIRAGGDEQALEMSYADLLDSIVKYFKSYNDSYIKFIEMVAKNV
jgi:hypothetical protein